MFPHRANVIIYIVWLWERSLGKSRGLAVSLELGLECLEWAEGVMLYEYKDIYSPVRKFQKCKPH